MTKRSRMLAAVGSMALGALAFAPLSVLHADVATKDVLKARHDHYHQLGDAFKLVRDEVRASSPDWKAIERAAGVVSKASVNQSKWFPKGSGPEAGKTRALPEIWARPADFDAAQKLFSDAAPKLQAAAKAKDAAGVQAQFGEVGKTCKNCHETFRSPEEH